MCDTSNNGTTKEGIQNVAPSAPSGVNIIPLATAFSKSASPQMLKTNTATYHLTDSGKGLLPVIKAMAQ